MEQKTSHAERIGFVEKVAFGLANLGNIPVMTLLNAFLLIFYTDVVGLNPAAVATLLLIARLIDGVNDPIMGFIIDHLRRTKMGRFRPYIILGSVVCALNLVMLWAGPVLFSGVKLLVVYVSYLLIGFTFDLMDIPLNSMIPVMTSDLKQRNTLSSIKGVSYCLGTVLFTMAGPLVIKASSTPLQGYLSLAIGAAIFIVTMSTLGALGTRERVLPIAEERYKFSDILTILPQRPVLATFCALLFYGVAYGMSAAMNMYYATYILDHRLDVVSLLSVFMILGLLPGLLVSAPLANAFGKRTVYSVGFFVFGLGLLARLVSPRAIPLIFASQVVSSIGMGLMMALAYGIQADNVDYVEWKRGHRAEGALASLNSFVLKAANGLAGAIPGYVMAATGYVPNAVQSPSALSGIMAVSVVLPAAVMISGGVVFTLFYNIRPEQMVFIESELRARREGGAK
jgi:sugar (glycoside-pentoside-hexuronide) transporter